MANFDLITIAIFSLIVVICGLSFSGSGKSLKSFFAGDGDVPWWISGLSLFMNFHSAGTFVVWGAIAYQYGWVAVVIQWTMGIAGILAGIIFAPKWQKTGALTAAEFITRRLGYNTQKIYSYFFLFISIFTTGAFLYPVAKILQVYAGISITSATIGIGLLIIIYTAIGGMWAVVVTDVLQFVILTAAVLIVVPLAFQHVGGISSFVQQAPDSFFNFFNKEYSIGFLIAFTLYNLFFLSGNWAYVQRYTTVKDTKSAKKVGWSFGILYFISPVIWMLPPMIYRLVDSNLIGAASEGAYMLMCKAVLPVGIMGLMLGGMIFATSGAANNSMNIAAGVFTNDLYRHFFPKNSQKHLVMVGRIATLVFGLLAIGMALSIPYIGGIVEVVLSLGAITGGAMYLPPLWALFSKRQTGFSVLSITILSLIINLFFKFVTPPLFGFSLSRSMEMIVGAGIPIVLLGLYEFWLSRTQRENLDYQRYQQTMSLHQEEKKSLAADKENQEDNIRGRKILATGVWITGVLIILLGIHAIKTTWIVLVMGILVLFTGFMMRPGGKRS
jgi:SSS family transporter